MNPDSVIYEKKDGIGTITLNRPDKLNAINDAMWEEIGQALELAEPDLEVKVVVIKGAGKSFSVGQDLGGTENPMTIPPESQAKSSIKARLEAEQAHSRSWEYIFNLAKPTIAQVHGYCLGTGLNLAMMCDFTIASKDALFGDPSIRMGILPASPLLIWLIGTHIAKELFYTGRYMDAEEAEYLGLINTVVPGAELDETVNRLAKGLSLIHPDALAVGKDAVNAVMEARGVLKAQEFTNYMQILWQERDIDPEAFKFFEASDKKGLKAAFMERDAPFKNFL